MFPLVQIKETSQQVAEAIAAVLDVDVEIINANCERIAGTGQAKRKIGCQLDYGFIYRFVLKTKKPYVVEQPGHHQECAPCPLYLNCFYTASIIYPILYQGEALGAISLITFDRDQEKILLTKQEKLLEFIGRMSDLLSSKVAERELIDRITLATTELRTVMDSVAQGIVAVNQEGAITHVNSTAEELIGLKAAQLIGKPLTSLNSNFPFAQVLQTGEGYTEREMVFNINNKTIRFISTATPIIVENQVVGAVRTIHDISAVSKLIYEMIEKRNYSFDDIVGNSREINELKQQALRVSGSNSTVLIRGESGTGKELFARAIHEASPRRNGPFIAINCAAIPEALLESELFGYEDGAFTGAKRGGKPGKFEMAQKGTLFLDEIGDMPLHLQTKLLRVLEQRQFERVGGTESISVDVRIIAATNKDLEAAINQGEFREDLFYRLNVIPIHIKPLRQRKDDIHALIKFFLERYNILLNKHITGVSEEALKILLQYPWPGNVRELENTIQYCVHMETGPEIKKHSLPLRIREFSPQEVADNNGIIPLEELEKKAILSALKKFGTSVEGKQKAADALQISLTTLYRKLNKWQLQDIQ